MKPTTRQSASFSFSPGAVSLSASLSDREGEELLQEVNGHISRGEKSLAIDLTRLKKIDSRGGAWLIRAVQRGEAGGTEITLRGAHGEVADFIELIRPSFKKSPAREIQSPGIWERIGKSCFAVARELRGTGRLLVDATYWSFIAPLEGRKTRWQAMIRELDAMGVQAVGIISLINFLMGVVIAVLSAAQMHRFGLEIFIASLMVIGFARELAGVMTGIMVSARSGSAIASELATMKVSEEIDALRGMGINLSYFLIAPKVLAIIIAVPILTTIGFLAGVAGGFATGIFFLGFTFQSWGEQSLKALAAGDILQGLFKSLVFALIIVIVGCRNGLKVIGGARGVGEATTRSVVMDIFLIVVADMIFAVLFFFIL